MVYLTARTAAHLYKSPSSLDLSHGVATNGGPKSLLVASNGSSKCHSLLYCTPSVRFSNSSSSNSSGSRSHGSSWTLNSRVGNGTNHQGYEYSQSKSTLDLTWCGKASLTNSIIANNNNNNKPKKSHYSSASNLKSKSLFNLRQALVTVPSGNGHTHHLPSDHSNDPQRSSFKGFLPMNRSIPNTKTDRRSHEQIRMAKQRASILWLIAKANDGGRIPSELRDPFYRDHNGQELLKPWITQRLANGELYGRALANIYGVPDYSCLGHQGILQLLTRRGVYVQDLSTCEEPITETILLKTSPLKLDAHMTIIECILTLYVREILIPVKVGECVSRFSAEYENFDAANPQENLPPSAEPEDVALFWVNRACAYLNQEIARDYMTAIQEGDARVDPDEPCAVVPTLEELSDMCDGCSLFGLLTFYCSSMLSPDDIVLKQDISIADSIYNLQRVQNFTAEHFPSDVCFLTLEDFLYLPEPLVPNFLAFIADLLFMFEIQPIECVSPLYLRFPEEVTYSDEFHPNYPQLPTPAEMRARSLKHQTSWNNDSLESSTIDQSSAFYNHPSTHQLYNERRSSLYKSGSSTALNQTSRRNSLSAHNNNNGSRHLHRRSSVMSNGSESQQVLNADLDETYVNGGLVARHQHYSQGGIDGDNENGMALEPGGQLSSYFSTLTVPNNQSGRSGQGATNSADAEYYKNRNRASSGHLQDYFSNLTLTDVPPQEQQLVYPTNSRTNTHVKAKVGHPNNTDNVKQLLSHHHMPHHHHSAFSNAANDSQTTSSDTSSIAELSEYSELVRAQLSEKRKQIELERQQEREKRQSVDQNFRQEVLRTLKTIQHNSGNESNSDIDPTENGSKLMDNVNNNSGMVDDENLTFEIHELHPIRREKTFTTLSPNTSGSSNKSNNYKKDLFSASDDLKASMTDLHYSNAKDGKTRLVDDDTLKRNNSNKSIETFASKLDSSKYRSSSPISESTNILQTQSTNVHEMSDATVLSPTSVNVLQPAMSNPAMNTTPRRGQWGQPMIPLPGHYPQHPGNWGQGPYAPEWYAASQGYPHPPPPQTPYGYPYTMAPPGATPYSAQYPPYGQPPPPGAEPYMSMGGYGPPPNNVIPPPPSVASSSVYSSSPVLNSAQVPSSTQPSSATNAATFRVPKNGETLQNGFNSEPTNTHSADHYSLNQTNQYSADISSHDNSSIADTSQNDSTSHQHQVSAAEKHNEAFFISFPDERPQTRPSTGNKASTAAAAPRAQPKAPKQELLSPEKQPLARTATQTLISRSSENDGHDTITKSTPEKNKMSDDVIKKLYEVKRTPATPAVAFTIGVKEEVVTEIRVNGAQEETMADMEGAHSSQPITEEDMIRKKELIMKQSFRRRMEQEEKRAEKERELAAKREAERLRQEQKDREKEEKRQRQAAILEQYKQKKQLVEEMERNGGPLPVSRSSSTLVLNRQAGTGQASSVTMRPQRLLSGGRPRPKSLHSTMVGLDGNPIGSGNASISSGDTVSRHSSSRDEIDLVGRIGSAASRPQSSMSSTQLNSVVTTPTGGNPFGDQYEQYSQYSSAGPTSSNFYEYSGPKLFVKPSQKSNKTLILNAINVVLAGAVNAETNRRVAEVINSCDSKYYLILFRNSGLQYRAIYSYYPERDEVTKLDGIGPRTINNEMIEKFYKYNSGTKSFTPIQTKHLCVTIDAFTIHNNLWMSKKQQQQQQMTPRRFI